MSQDADESGQSGPDETPDALTWDSVLPALRANVQSVWGRSLVQVLQGPPPLPQRKALAEQLAPSWLVTFEFASPDVHPSIRDPNNDEDVLPLIDSIMKTSPPLLAWLSARSRNWL